MILIFRYLQILANHSKIALEFDLLFWIIEEVACISVYEQLRLIILAGTELIHICSETKLIRLITTWHAKISSYSSLVNFKIKKINTYTKFNFVGMPGPTLQIEFNVFQK